MVSEKYQNYYNIRGCNGCNEKNTCCDFPHSKVVMCGSRRAYLTLIFIEEHLTQTTWHFTVVPARSGEVLVLSWIHIRFCCFRYDLRCDDVMIYRTQHRGHT